jgi:hypothetical protein
MVSKDVSLFWRSRFASEHGSCSAFSLGAVGSRGDNVLNEDDNDSISDGSRVVTSGMEHTQARLCWTMSHEVSNLLLIASWYYSDY